MAVAMILPFSCQEMISKAISQDNVVGQGLHHFGELGCQYFRVLAFRFALVITFLTSPDPQLVIPTRRFSTAGGLVKRESSAFASH